MDSASLTTLARLIRAQRVGALGTLDGGAPFVSLVLVAPAADFGAFFLHISTLAHHTRHILQDDRVSLMLAEPDPGHGDPQTLARLSLRARAVALERGSAEYSAARAVYLARFPEAAFNFSLADFGLFRIEPTTARYVAGFGKIFNLRVSHLNEAAAVAL